MLLDMSDVLIWRSERLLEKVQSSDILTTSDLENSHFGESRFVKISLTCAFLH